MSLLFLPEVPKEVLVSNSDIGDDRLGDEEWSVISSARLVRPNIIFFINGSREGPISFKASQLRHNT